MVQGCLLVIERYLGGVQNILDEYIRDATIQIVIINRTNKNFIGYLRHDNTADNIILKPNEVIYKVYETNIGLDLISDVGYMYVGFAKAYTQNNNDYTTMYEDQGYEIVVNYEFYSSVIMILNITSIE